MVPYPFLDDLRNVLERRAVLGFVGQRMISCAGKFMCILQKRIISGWNFHLRPLHDSCTVDERNCFTAKYYITPSNLFHAVMA